MKIRGIEINLHENEDLSNHIRREGDFFEAEILDYIRDNFNHQRTILDIGANIGNHSLYFANFLSYECILAFEPVPANYALFLQNLHGFDNVLAAPYALGDRTGEAMIKPNFSNMGASEISENDGIKVPIIALDRFGLSAVSLMKIDVEWYEPQVLEGVKDTIFKCRPLILIEDANKEYDKLLPNYELLKAWEHHKTYLYGWKDA